MDWEIVLLVFCLVTQEPEKKHLWSVQRLFFNRIFYVLWSVQNWTYSNSWFLITYFHSSTDNIVFNFGIKTSHRWDIVQRQYDMEFEKISRINEIKSIIKMQNVYEQVKNWMKKWECTISWFYRSTYLANVYKSLYKNL